MTATVFYDNINEIALLTNTFTNSAGAPASPSSVSCIVTDPSNTSVTHTYGGAAPADIVMPATGTYTLSLPCSPASTGIDGLWGYEWIGTGAVSDVQPGTWRVFPAGIGQLWYIGMEEFKDRLGITDTTDDYQIQIAIQSASQAVNEHCVVPSTMILTADLRWVQAGDLFPGQEIIGVDEEPAANSHFLRGTNHNRAYRRATVLATPRRMAECIRLVMADGREVTCAADHRWLARWNNFTRGRSHVPPNGFQGHGYQWVHARDIVPGTEIASPLRVWPEETSFEAGWISGLYDGEGWIAHPGTPGNSMIGFGQNPGVVLDGLLKYLDNTGIPYASRIQKPGEGTYGKDSIARIEIGTRSACMELMGRLRPRRLMPYSAQLWEDRRMIRGLGPNSAWVTAAEPAGVQEVVSLATSTGTYLAEGLVSHNCARHFNRVTETRTYQPLNIWLLEVDDIVPGAAITVNVDDDGDGIYETPMILGTDYQLRLGKGLYNVNATGIARPYRELQIIQSGKWFPFTWPYAHLDRVQIATTWGWPSIPPPVTQGTFLIASQLFKLKDAPFGIAGNANFGTSTRTQQWAASSMIQGDSTLMQMFVPYINSRRKVGVLSGSKLAA